MRYILVIISLLFAMPALANNVVPVKGELSASQVEWLNKNEAHKDSGIHHNFVWYRAADGIVWSVSINEYKKSTSQDIVEYMDEVINTRLNAERATLMLTLAKATSLVEALVATGMVIPQAIIIAAHVYPGLELVDGNPVVKSTKYPSIIAIK